MVCDKMHESTRPQEAVISCGFGPKQRLKILFKPEGTTCEQVKQENPKLKNLADTVKENKKVVDKRGQTKKMKEKRMSAIEEYSVVNIL